jgi:hypothetical protein
LVIKWRRVVSGGPALRLTMRMFLAGDRRHDAVMLTVNVW